MNQCGGCGCSMGGRRRKTRKGGQPKRETIKEMVDRLDREKTAPASKPTIAELAAKIKARQEALKGKKVGGTVVGDALLAGTAVGLYSYFTRKNRRGGLKLPKRKTKKALV